MAALRNGSCPARAMVLRLGDHRRTTALKFIWGVQDLNATFLLRSPVPRLVP